MSKGSFNTPRDLGQVTEIVSRFIQIKRQKKGGEPIIVANMQEGEEQPDGSFFSQVDETIEIRYNTLSAGDKIIVDRLLKLVVEEYASVKGYTVTVP